MTHALRDASSLSAVVAAGLGGSRALADAVNDHQRRRDRAIRGMYDFTLSLAAFAPPRPIQRLVLAAVAADQQETDRFLGAVAGIVPPEDYFTLGTMMHILGSQGIRKLTAITAGRLSSGRWRRDSVCQANADASMVPGRSLGTGRCGR